MVGTADEIQFAFQTGNEVATPTVTSTMNNNTASLNLAPPPLPTQALMPPPPPRVRPPREQEGDLESQGHEGSRHERKGLGDFQALEQHEQQQQLLEREEEIDPHNQHLPVAAPEALGGGDGALADKLNLMHMVMVDAECIMEGKGSLMGPTTPIMQGVGMESYPRSLVMGLGAGEAFDASDSDEGEKGECEDGGTGEGMFGKHLERRVVQLYGYGVENEEDEEIHEAEGGYISSSSECTKTTLEHLQQEHRGAHNHKHPNHSPSPAVPGISRSQGQGPSAAAMAAAAAATSSRSRCNNSSSQRRNQSSNNSHFGGSSRPVRVEAAIRRQNPSQEARRSPPLNGSGGGTPQGRGTSGQAATRSSKKCNCRKSKCLKLYCECFAMGAYCRDDCGCVDCNNTLAFEQVRTQAVESILSRNPHAFTEKIQFIETGATGPVAMGTHRRTSLPGGQCSVGDNGETTMMGGLQGTAGGALPTAAHVRGCNCKKSLCIKKYCECFFAGVYCGENCQCEGCQNNPEASAGLHVKKKRGSTSHGKGQHPKQVQRRQQASPSLSDSPDLTPTRVTGTAVI